MEIVMMNPPLSEIKSDMETIEFYSDIICKKGANTIDYLYSRTSNATANVKKCIVSDQALRDFFCKYPQIFCVSNNLVTLGVAASESKVKWIFKILGKDGCPPNIAKSMLNAIQFYTDILLEKDKGFKFPINQLVTHRNKAKEDVQIIATNPGELKSFLGVFPQIFNILEEDHVALTPAARHFKSNFNWINELLNLKTKSQSKNKCDDPLLQLYYEEIKRSCLYANPIKELIKGVEMIHKTKTITEHELKQLLSTHQDIAIIDDNQVIQKSMNNQTLLPESKEKNKIVPADKSDKNYKTILFYSLVLEDVAGLNEEFPIIRLKERRNYILEECKDEGLTISNKECKEMKSFFKSYPYYFKINNNSVAVIISVQNENAEREFCEIIKKAIHTVNVRTCPIKEGIDFYSTILRRFCFNLEVPISHLFGYRTLAPLEVISLLRSDSNLKKFLSDHSDIFYVHGDMVGLVKRSATKARNSDAQIMKAVRFYECILENADHTIPLPIVRMFCFQTSAPSDIKDLIKTPLELKAFLVQHPDIFTVINDSVMLERFRKVNLYSSSLEDNSGKVVDLSISKQNNHIASANLKADNPEQKPELEILKNSKLCKSVIKTIRFYSNIIFRKGTSEQCLFPIGNLVTHKTKASNDVKEMVKTAKELKIFLCNYPSLFTVVDDHVFLTDPVTFNENQEKWIREALDNNANAPVNDGAAVKAIHFYSDIIFESQQEITLTKLFSFTSKASSDVKSLTPNVKVLTYFLAIYPKIFSITNDKVTLTELAISHMSLPTWIGELIVGTRFSYQDRNYYVKDTTNPLDLLTEHPKVDISGVSKDEQNSNETFLKPGPSKSALSSKKSNKKKSDALMSKIDLELYRFYQPIMENAGEFPFEKLYDYISFAPSQCEFKDFTPAKLMDFFLKHSDVFIISGNCVRLKPAPNVEVMSKQTLEEKKKSESGQTLEEKKKSESSQVPKVINIQHHGRKASPGSSTQEIQKITATFEKKVATSDSAQNKNSVVAAIQFYSNIIFRKGPYIEYPIGKLFSHLSQAPTHVKAIAKNPQELRDFLCRFPKLFTVNNDKFTVILADLLTFAKNQRQWIADLLPKYHNSTVNHESVISAIQFYSNIIFDKDPRKVFPLMHLINHRQKALHDVQSVAKNIFELKDFLSKYPEIFIVSDDKVFLSNLAISHKTEPKWILQLISSEDTKSKPEETISDNSSTVQNEANKKLIITKRKAVQFYYRILKSDMNTSKSLVELLSFRNEASTDVQEVAKSKEELKSFLLNYPHLFTVIDDVVCVTSFTENSLLSSDLQFGSKKKENLIFHKEVR